MKEKASEMTADVKWQDITVGCSIYEGGTSHTVKTGDWRTEKPVFDKEKCKQCLLCVPACPDMSIPMNAMVRGGILTISFAKAAESALRYVRLMQFIWFWMKSKRRMESHGNQRKTFGQ